LQGELVEQLPRVWVMLDLLVAPGLREMAPHQTFPAQAVAVLVMPATEATP